MSDLVKRLRESGCANGCNTAKVCICAYNEDAADEIERLTARSEVAEARVEKLRHALLPFANIAADDGDDFSRYEKEVIIRYEASVGEISLARKVLEESK